MKTGQFPITTASAIVFASLLAFPMHSLAQSNASLFGGRAPKPVCVYKGVMSDVEIEVCTGYRVNYNYAIYPGRTVVEERAGVVVQQTTSSGRTSRPTKKRRQP